MLQRVSIVMSEQKTINSILMNLHPVQSVTAPVRTRSSLPSGSSGAPYPRTNAGRAPKKFKMKKLRKEEEQQRRLAEKGAKRARKSIQKVNNK